jgi:hypothetical protein
VAVYFLFALYFYTALHNQFVKYCIANMGYIRIPIPTQFSSPCLEQSSALYRVFLSHRESRNISPFMTRHVSYTHSAQQDQTALSHTLLLLCEFYRRGQESLVRTPVEPWL